MSGQYLSGDVMPKRQQTSTAKCSIPFVETLFCGLVSPLQALSWMLLRAEACVWAPTLETISARVETAIGTDRTQNLRHLFLNNEVIQQFPMRVSHSHPDAAMYRTSMNHYMKRLVRNAGLTPYMVSMSNMDAQEGCDGSRLFHGTKDLSVPHRFDDVRDDHVLIFVDVDYYADMNKWLRYRVPILLYTLVPRSVAETEENDYSYRWINNKVEYVVAGGAKYNHEIWNYSIEKLCVVNDDGTTATFLVEQRNIPNDPTHRYVVIVPETRVKMPYNGHLGELQYNPLVRMRPLQDDVNVLYDPITDNVSIGADGSWHCVNMTGRLYSAIKSRIIAKEGPYTVSDIERIMNSHKHPSSTTSAPLLHSLMKAGLIANVVSTNGAICYQPTKGLVHENGKPVGRAGATPLVQNPAVFAANSYNADLSTVDGRIHDVRNTKVPNDDFKHYANEFIQFLVPEGQRNVGVPLSVQATVELQDLPSQRARYALVAPTMSVESPNSLTSFVKAEAYSKVNHPRNITPMKPETTTQLSSYTIAFKKAVLKHCKWYGPGKTPNEQIDRLQEIAGLGFDFLATDYTKLDGTVSEFLQKELIQKAYVRWFHANHKADFKKQFGKVFVQKGITKNGVPFKPGFGTRSGSPQTTDGNTIVCAYVVYCALRELGYDTKDAWEALDLYYGDDGVTAARVGMSDALEAAARELGLKLKCSRIARGEPLPFLGRIFCDICTSRDSLQDPGRTLGKIHLTANREVSEAQAMANKAFGYLPSDEKTPVIGTWCRKVVEITQVKEMKNATREENYKLSNCWPQTDAKLIAETMAKVLGISEAELIVMDEKISEVTALDQFPNHTEFYGSCNLGRSWWRDLWTTRGAAYS
jgi:hypothetical protein